MVHAQDITEKGSQLTQIVVQVWDTEIALASKKRGDRSRRVVDDKSLILTNTPAPLISVSDRQGKNLTEKAPGPGAAGRR
jgi:hypothetical protein